MKILLIYILFFFGCKKEVEYRETPSTAPTVKTQKPIDIAKALVEPLSGKWEGMYRDCYGFAGRIDIDLLNDSGSLSGTALLTIFDEESSDKYKGSFSGEVKDSQLYFKAYPLNANPDTSQTVSFTGKLKFNNEAYALQTMYGTIDAPKNDRRSMLGGGVWIVWYRGE